MSPHLSVYVLRNSAPANPTQEVQACTDPKAVLLVIGDRHKKQTYIQSIMNTIFSGSSQNTDNPAKVSS